MSSCWSASIRLTMLQFVWPLHISCRNCLMVFLCLPEICFDYRRDTLSVNQRQDFYIKERHWSMLNSSPNYLESIMTSNLCLDRELFIRLGKAAIVSGKLEKCALRNTHTTLVSKPASMKCVLSVCSPTDNICPINVFVWSAVSLAMFCSLWHCFNT